MCSSDLVAAPADVELVEGEGPAPGPARPRGRFRILRLLDSGGTGDVFVALDGQLGREVALKQLQATFARDLRHCLRFESEARLTATLEHPGVAPVYAAARRASGVPYYVCKLIRGETFAEAIGRFHAEHRPWRRRDRPSHVELNRLLNRFLAVCDTITYAHGRAVIHRDLKPQNVVLGDHGETVVVDWGLARAFGPFEPQNGEAAASGLAASRDTPPLTVSAVGTPGYASPEQLAGDSHAVGPASDIFALGATLYQLITGRPPFPAGESTRSLTERVRAGRFPSPRSLHRRIPRALEAVVLKALATAPGDRYASARELADDVERWMADEPVSAWREPLSERARRAFVRHPALALALAALTLGGLGLWGFARQRSAEERATVDVLLRQLSAAPFEEVPGVARLLAAHPDIARGRLRALSRDPGVSRDVALNATLALLAFDPETAAAFGQRLADNPREARDLVARLLKVGRTDPRRTEPLGNLLFQVRRTLFAPLADAVSESGRLNESDDLAASILIDIAADNPEVLTKALPDVGLAMFSKYLKPLTRTPDVAIPLLERVLREPPAARNEPPLDPSWPDAGPTLVRQLEAAGGMVEPRFALCQTLPLDELAPLTEGLRPCGYRPTRVRPYRDGPLVRVAVVWTRDGLWWSLSVGLRDDEVRDEQRRQRALGRWPVDAAAYLPLPGTGNEPPLHVSVWSELPATGTSPRPARELPMWEVPGHRPAVTSYEVHLDVAGDGANRVDARNLATGRRPVTRQRLRTAGGERLAQVWYAVDEHALEWPHPATCDEKELTRRLAHRSNLWDLALSTDPSSPSGPVVYDLTFVSGDGLECEVPHGLSPAAHRDRCAGLAREGYRPVAVAAAGRAVPGQVVAGSVWQRPSAEKRYLSRQDTCFRQARATAALALLGRPGPLWEALRHGPDPTVRSLLLRDARVLGIGPETFIGRLGVATEVSERRALLLALAPYTADEIPAPARAALRTQVLTTFADDPDPGIHGAAALLLRRWGLEDEIRRREAGLRSADPARDRLWFVNRQGQTFTVVRGPVTFAMGEPVHDEADEHLCPQNQVEIPRSFAVMTTEVTVGQFRPFVEALKRRGPVEGRLATQDRFAAEDTCPMLRLTWFDAARYCNWLSEAEGVPEPQRCYVENADGTVALREYYLDLAGYRLPTEAEWEFACRAGATTRWPYGRDEAAGVALLHDYAWSIASTAGNRTHPVGTKLPNDLGLFDMLGNAHEWCQDPYDAATYHAGEPGRPRRDVEFPTGPVPEKKNRVLRGGWFHYSSDGLTATARSWDWAAYINTEDGFRVARTVR